MIAKEVFANGRLTDANDRPEDRAPVSRLRGIAGDLALDRLAVAFVAAQPFVDVVLSGAATVAQLGSNVTAISVDLDGATLEALRGHAEAPARYWATRAALRWS